MRPRQQPSAHFRLGLELLGRARNQLGLVVWPPYSRLFLVSDSPIWVLSWEMREVAAIAGKLGVRVASGVPPFGLRRQVVFYASQFFLMNPAYLNGHNRIGFAYFHGRPSAEEPNFTACYEALVRYHERIDRIQVSHAAMRDLVLESGIAPQKVFLIPIGINLSYFHMQTSELKRQAREAYGLPQSAVVVGSFQKDGVGWGEGLEPKKVKGPDIFLKAIELLKSRVSELFVLLSGPARGYVRAGLQRMGVPYRHFYYEKNYPEVGRLFQALDLYLVASREEGGPKAVLESMASGVPLITTRVGQATDLVQHGRNGWIVDVEDTEGLAHWAEYAVTNRNTPAVENVVGAGRQTAEANSYEAQIPLWRELFRGFVECS